MTTLQARKKTHELISPQEYLRRRGKDFRLVEGARIVMPKFGEGGFGAFRVPVKKPQYEVMVERDE